MRAKIRNVCLQTHKSKFHEQMLQENIYLDKQKGKKTDYILQQTKKIIQYTIQFNEFQGR